MYQYAADHTTLTCCCMHLEVWLSALTTQQHRCMQLTQRMLKSKENHLDVVHIAVLPVSALAHAVLDCALCC